MKLLTSFWLPNTTVIASTLITKLLMVDGGTLINQLVNSNYSWLMIFGQQRINAKYSVMKCKVIMKVTIKQGCSQVIMPNIQYSG